MAILMTGLRGEPVRRLQAKLGVEVDGIFGPATEKALKEYQKKANLVVDGIAGPDTFAHMGLHELILLHKGTRGETVKKLQTSLGLTADGAFGPATEKALKKFQAEHGLAADGLAGPATLAKMELFKEISAATVAASQIPRNYVPVPPFVEAVAAPKIKKDDATGEGKPEITGASVWNTVKRWFSK
jgi:peptidoglycan hydrolase-like protein with peptidoglycan-binding domain